MRVLIAGEFSGIERDAFSARGHDAWSCDFLPSERPGNHIQDDFFNVLDRGWDLMIAHPTCRYITNSGVRWLYTEPGRWELMEDAARTIKRLLDADIEKIALEQPIPHKYALAIIGRKYDQIVQPWWFGHPETKATCFWLKNLPPLESTNIVDGREHRVHRMPPGPDRWRERSRAYRGMAAAQAEQWGKE